MATAVAIAGASVTSPGAAQAQHWHHGGGHWHGGGWGPGFALGLGLGAAPYYGGYYGYGPCAYGGGCYMRPRWVVNRWGHTVRRWVRVCY